MNLYDCLNRFSQTFLKGIDTARSAKPVIATMEQNINDSYHSFHREPSAWFHILVNEHRINRIEPIQEPRKF